MPAGTRTETNLISSQQSFSIRRNVVFRSRHQAKQQRCQRGFPSCPPCFLRVCKDENWRYVLKLKSRVSPRKTNCRWMKPVLIARTSVAKARFCIVSKVPHGFNVRGSETKSGNSCSERNEKHRALPEPSGKWRRSFRGVPHSTRCQLRPATPADFDL